MHTDSAPAIAVEVARLLIDEVALEERDMFDTISERFLEDPDAMQVAERDVDDMLGFGAGDAFTLLTPVILVVAKVAAELVWDTLVDVAKDTAKEKIGALVRRQFGMAGLDAAAGEAIALSPEHLVRIRQAVVAKAIEMKLPERDAAMLGDSIIGRLAVEGA
jgi:hypothetical protein